MCLRRVGESVEVGAEKKRKKRSRKRRKGNGGIEGKG